MATTFDGSSGKYRSIPLKGASDSGKGTFLVWGKMSADATGVDTFLEAKDSNTILWAGWSSNLLFFYLYDGGALDLAITGTTSWTSADGWVCYAVSYDLENSLYYAYRGNTDDTTESNAPSATSVALSSATEWGIGGYDFGGTLIHTLTGSVALVAFWPGVYVDLTDEDERRNLISNDGKPVGFGVDTSGRGGRSGLDTEAIVFFSDTFVKNRGTGGAFETYGSLSYTGNPDVYRPSSDRLTYGIRWYDSDRSGFSYPRTEMQRETSGDEGLRVGVDELDELDRDDFAEVDFDDLLDSEEDTEDVL